MLERCSFGYDHQARQPCDVFAVDLRLAGTIDLTQADAWLTEHFGVDPDTLSHSPANDGDALPARRLIDRAIILYASLMQAQNAPCFEKGRLVELERQGADMTRIWVALPVVDNVPQAAQRAVFDAAVRLIAGPFAQPPTLAAAEALFAELERSVFARLPIKAICATITLAVCEILYERGVPFRHIGGGVIVAGQGAHSHLIHRCAVDSDSSIGGKIAGDKRQTARLLKAAGLPTPVHQLVRTAAEAIEAAERLGWPVVVKPTDQERSNGVSVGVADADAVEAAFAEARRFSPNVIVERQLPGVCHRILVARGQVVYAVKRMPKGVRGNGRDSVAELITAANAGQLRLPPWKRLIAFPDDGLAQSCLQAAGLSLQAVPQDGQMVALRPHVSEEWGGVIDDLTAVIHPDNARLAIDATRALGLTIAGVDLMTTDIAQSWRENGATVIEMNYNPQFLTRGRQAASGAFAAALVEGDGRIEAHLVTGQGDLRAGAMRLREELAGRGLACHLASLDACEDAQGAPIHLLHDSAFDCGLALAMRRDVTVLILCVAPAELFRRGAPVDRLNGVVVVDDDRVRAQTLIDKIRRRFLVGECRWDMGGSPAESPPASR